MQSGVTLYFFFCQSSFNGYCKCYLPLKIVLLRVTGLGDTEASTLNHSDRNENR